MHRSVLMLGACLALLSGARSQEDPAPAPGRSEPPTEDPGLPDRLRELRGMVRDRQMREDYLAVEAIRGLATAPDSLHPRDRARIVDALGDVFRTGRLRPPDQVQLYQAAADALSAFGEDGARSLQRALSRDRLDGRDYARLRADMIRALGRTGDLRQVPWLLDQALRSPDDEVLAAAGAALGEFPQMPTEQLRDVTKRLIGRLGEWEMLASRLDPTDPNAPIDFGPDNARRTLKHVSRDWNDTLRKLTGESFTSAADWQHWRNKNKDWLPPGRDR